MSSLTIPVPVVKPSSPGRLPLEANEERTVSLRDAIALVKTATRVAFAVTVNSLGNHTVVDVPRSIALRSLRLLKGRVSVVNVSDLFGTLTIG